MHHRISFKFSRRKQLSTSKIIHGCIWQDHFFYFAVFDIQSDLGPDRLWSLPNDDQRTENGSVDDMWDFLFDYCQYCQRLPFRVWRPNITAIRVSISSFFKNPDQYFIYFMLLQKIAWGIFGHQIFCHIYYYCFHCGFDDSWPPNGVYLPPGFLMETSSHGWERGDGTSAGLQ